MNIADKLTQIAENEQKVYDAGFAAGQEQGGGSGEDRYQEGYDDGYQAGEREGFNAGYTDGQQAEYDRFWDEYQTNGVRSNSQGMFSGLGWNSETLKPKYSIRPKLAPLMFYYCNTHSNNDPIDLADVFDNRGLTLDFSNCTDFQQIFYQAKIEKVGMIDCSKASGSNQVLNIFNTEHLRIVRGFIPPNIALPAAAFQSNLEELNVCGTVTKSINLSRCEKLTAASIQSIIDYLADLTGQTAQTLTFHATVGGKLTTEQKTTISAKNWTLAY